jgi:NAD(P)-dependent dehydrogenase (short-subunit alcohol dehydrogenase family)
MEYSCFKKKTVFITGASSGIGRSSVLAFAKNGAKVFFIDIDEAGGNSLEKNCFFRRYCGIS